jgi:hypothetical protein
MQGLDLKFVTNSRLGKKSRDQGRMKFAGVLPGGIGGCCQGGSGVRTNPPLKLSVKICSREKIFEIKIFEIRCENPGFLRKRTTFKILATPPEFDTPTCGNPWTKLRCGLWVKSLGLIVLQYQPMLHLEYHTPCVNKNINMMKLI